MTEVSPTLVHPFEDGRLAQRPSLLLENVECLWKPEFEVGIPTMINRKLAYLPCVVLHSKYMERSKLQVLVSEFIFELVRKDAKSPAEGLPMVEPRFALAFCWLLKQLHGNRDPALKIRSVILASKAGPQERSTCACLFCPFYAPKKEAPEDGAPLEQSSFREAKFIREKAGSHLSMIHRGRFHPVAEELTMRLPTTVRACESVTLPLQTYLKFLQFSILSTVECRRKYRLTIENCAMASMYHDAPDQYFVSIDQAKVSFWAKDRREKKLLERESAEPTQVSVNIPYPRYHPSQY